MALLGVMGPTKQAFFTCDPDDHISGWFKAGRYYEADLLEAIRALGLGGTYVDVGAHVGNHTLYFALECAAERVIAIEPNAGYLKANVSRNGLADKVTVVEAIVHPTWKGAEPLGYAQERNSGTARFGKARNGPVAVVRLDDFLPAGVSLIKIDVEGSALDVLQTAESTITTQHPVLAVEGIDGDEVKAVGTFLRPLGYEPDGPYAVTPVWIWK